MAYPFFQIRGGELERLPDVDPSQLDQQLLGDCQTLVSAAMRSLKADLDEIASGDRERVRGVLERDSLDGRWLRLPGRPFHVHIGPMNVAADNPFFAHAARHDFWMAYEGAVLGNGFVVHAQDVYEEVHPALVGTLCGLAGAGLPTTDPERLTKITEMSSAAADTIFNTKPAILSGLRVVHRRVLGEVSPEALLSCIGSSLIQWWAGNKL